MAVNTQTKKSTAFVKAKHLMSRSLVFVHTSDTVRQAAAAMLDKGISGLPVLNHRDEPVGVITKTDIVRYEREYVAANDTVQAFRAMKAMNTLELIAQGQGFHRETEEDYVIHWMTPKIYAVSEEASLADVVRELFNHRVHRIFVRQEDSGNLTGVITTFDLLDFLADVFMVKPPKKDKKRG